MTTPLGQVTGELRDVREFASYGSYSILPTISNTKFYTGGYSVRLVDVVKCPGLQFAAQDSLRAGYWCNHNGLSASSDNAMIALGVLKSINQEVDIVWKRGGDGLAISLNGIVLALANASGAGALTTPNEWIHIGITYVGGVAGTVTLFVNGLPKLSYTGDLPLGITACYGLGVAGNFGTSFNTTALAIGQVVQGGQYSFLSYAYMDDFYVDGDITNASESPPPDRFLFSLASGAGASSQWTPTGQATNIACVDEAVPNDDTDYVKAEAADLVDLYGTTDITLPTDYGIVDVRPIALAKRMASGPTVKLVASDGVNADMVGAEKTPGTSYGYVWESMQLAPDGGAWTEAKVNAAQFGVKSAGVYA